MNTLMEIFSVLNRLETLSKLYVLNIEENALTII